jgi:hypothetical protein
MLLDPTKSNRKQNLFLSYKLLPSGCLARKLQDDNIIQGTKISNDASMVTTKKLIDVFLPFEGVQSQRPAELEDSIRRATFRYHTCARYVFAL